MDDGGRRAGAGDCRTDDGIADDPPALAGAHHAAIMLGRPGLSVVVEFTLVEAAAGRHGDLVVVVLGPVEHVALDAQQRLLARQTVAAGRRAHADGQTGARNVDVGQPALELGARLPCANDGRFRQLEVSHSGLHPGQRELVQVGHAVLHLVAGKLLQQPDVGHEWDFAVVAVWISRAAAGLASVHQHDVAAGAGRSASAVVAVLDAEARDVDQLQNRQTVGQLVPGPASAGRQRAGDGHVVVEIAFLVDVDPAESRPVGGRRVSDRIQQDGPVLRGQMRLAGQPGHQFTADFRHWKLFRRHIDVQFAFVEKFQVLGGQPAHRSVDPADTARLFAVDDGQHIGHIFDDSGLLVGFAGSAGLDGDPGDFRLESAQFDPVVDGARLADVHPGQSGRRRRSRRLLLDGEVAGLGRDGVAGGDERVEQIAGDARAERASQPDIWRPFGVNAQHNVSAQ